jgi:arabinogalactan endo-1,4-beta-galactosidase
MARASLHCRRNVRSCLPRRVAALAIAGLAVCLGQSRALGQPTPAAASSPDAAPPARPLVYLGADVSALAGGQTGRRRPGFLDHYQENGQTDSEINIMHRHGWNAFRLRVFVSPVRQAPNNNLENTIALAKQIKAAGATFLLDIHYSDTWADPQHQETPLAWRNLDVDQLEHQVEDYSRDLITQLKEAGVMPDMVQVGNEITGGMLWPTGHVQVPHSDVKMDAGRIQPLPDPYDDARQWSNLLGLINAGVRGVRAASADQSVKIVIHIDCGGDWPVTKWFFDHLADANVDFDVIGQSFYPFYHGTLDGVRQNMTECDRRYHKPIMIVETGYPQTGGEQITQRKYMQWPGTQSGQRQFLVELASTVRNSPGGLGVFYWAPEGSRGNGLWNPDGTPAPAISIADGLK